MPEGISKQEAEPIIVEVLKDKTPEDFTESNRGQNIFFDFIRKLIKKYPDKIYSGEEDVENTFEVTGGGTEHCVTFLGKNSRNITGIFIGHPQEKTFRGEWFVIDPEYQNGDTAKKIFEAIDKEFNEIRLIAMPFATDKNMTEEEEEKRHKALIRYYKRWGFEIDPKDWSNEGMEPQQMSGMVRRKSQE